ncbi:MAG: SPOR domain-containing protein [Phycisphaerae bacterium]|jgi:hypothetical protein|nr:SPOR domain-containing protein [Phycisphaerae bacterium]
MRKLLLSVLLLPFIASCESQPSALERSIQEYQNDQWLLSEMWAENSIESNKSVGEAQYMMGLCEFKRKRLDSAETWFIKASQSTNEEVQGKATAMLGIISEHEGDFETASLAFANAAKKLTGLDKKEANARAIGSSTIPSTTTSFFTLQFGAYRDKSNATSAIASLAPNLKNVGISPVWISEDTDRSGRVLYLVQGGKFSTRASASIRKKRGDLPQCNVTMAN